ncbi:signal transduction histidine kinase [Paenibacillus sp. PastF-3]|uniref:sensor histidine kinase n=1 Tax=unclassified Paenibacillus TaxID=185978 RepID=UPI000B9FD5AE|nr:MULTISPECIES: HAMP domain-containing sensor histidine kinase [unclassified Paenibacillus]MDH6369908.1 signal transduction histidine kinase [Paenibacillus sp. PastF-3]OZQ89283.1 two-component sensor histidine kinase [Paenibacillus sp. VTT E-133291]
MSIRWKFLLSYAAMLVVPLLLLIITAMLMSIVYHGDVQSLKSTYESKFEGMEENDIRNLIKHTFLQNTDLLTDTAFLNELSADMTKRNTSVYIRSEDQILYASEDLKLKQGLTDHLPGYKGDRSHIEPIRQQFNNEWYQVGQFDLLSKDAKPVSIFFLTPIDPLVQFVRTFFPTLFLITLVILVLTHTLLTKYMSRRIIRPLLELRKATKRVTEGDLDFQVEISGKDELGQLGMAFEEMRHRLQQSILVQQQYETNRKELITNISHDLKTPITAIKGYVDGILEGIADSPEKNEKYMRTIAAKAGEMDHLINELFLYSKLDMQKLPFSFESVRIIPFLNDWAEELKVELEKQEVALNIEMTGGEEVWVSVDRDSFKRVLGNIIQNSLKYMDKLEKKITVHSWQEETQFILAIEDNGPGIPPEATEHIFERFYRGEQSRNTHTGGSGLGLAIAKQIITGHGGTIYANSTEGIGTIIYIALPIVKGDIRDEPKHTDC